MHLLFLSPDWLIFCDMIISLLYKFTRVFFFVFLFILCFSLTKGQCSKRQTILYRPFYISICVSTLPTQHTTFISLLVYVFVLANTDSQSNVSSIDPSSERNRSCFHVYLYSAYAAHYVYFIFLCCQVYRVTSQSVKISGTAGAFVLVLTFLWLV